MAKVKLAMEAPVVVAQAAPGERRWGYVQFPAVERLGGGDIHIAYHIAEDSATAYGHDRGHAISSDGGASFVPVRQDPQDGGLLMPNGDRIRSKQLPSVPVDEMELPEQIGESRYCYGLYYPVYRQEDFPEKYSGFSIERLPAGGSAWETETKQVRVPGLVRYTVQGVFPHQMITRLRLAPNGRLWAITYPPCMTEDGTAEFQAAFMVSDDNGKTFRFLSKIPYRVPPQSDKFIEGRCGFHEPDLAFMPDGSIICLLRTENGYEPGTAPLYISRSTDGGETWSSPALYDDIGVWPNLLALKNGVTLACYGRPGLYLRATADPAGLQWDDRVTVVEPGKRQHDTCSYAVWLELGDDEALLVYSDFNWPNPEGEPVKTILARKVKTAIQ